MKTLLPFLAWAVLTTACTKSESFSAFNETSSTILTAEGNNVHVIATQTKGLTG